MMRNSSRVILSIPRLSGVDDGEYRRRRVKCRVARGLGRARSHGIRDFRVATHNLRRAEVHNDFTLKLTWMQSRPAGARYP